jgi:Ca-activated chloride channel family protein
MSFPSDNSLDAQLRDVSVPPDLAAQIIRSLTPTDEQLDGLLRAVVVPETLTPHLLDIPSDLALEESLAAVPVPLTLVFTARRPTFRQRAGRIARQLATLALAASWFVGISLALAGAGASLLESVYPRPEYDPIEIVMIYNGPLAVQAELVDNPPAMPISVAVLPLEESVEPSPVFTSTQSALLAQTPLAEPDWTDAPSAGPVTQWTGLVAGGLRPWDDVVLLRYGILGSPQSTDDHLPDLESPILPRATGIEPPRVRGYDRAFFLKNRVFPPIAPAANPALAALDIPLVTESGILARIESALAQGQRPPRADIRVEDFLAAMDYRFPAAPAGRLALRTAGGPAPFGPAGTNLLQVGVQAGSVANRTQPATHLVLAIDLSHSMRRGGRLEMVQQGVERLLDQIGPRDRLSLVVFQEEIVQHIELATRDDAADIRQVLAELSPRGGSNLAAGLQQGAALAMLADVPAGCTRRLVLITDSPAEMPADTLDQVRQLLIAARDAGVRLDVLDLAGLATTDPVLTDLAQNLGGNLSPVNSPRALGWALLDSLTGGSPIVAADAKLTLQFNPNAVAAYRLVGHEASPLAELKPAEIQADLAAGEAATALVEIWFRPAEINDVGQAILTWREPGGQSHRLVQKISRLQFAPTFGESAISLQQAAVAAEIGSQLRGDHAALREIGLTAGPARGMSGVLSLTRQVNAQLRGRADFERLVNLAGKLNK